MSNVFHKIHYCKTWFYSSHVLKSIENKSKITETNIRPQYQYEHQHIANTLTCYHILDYTLNFISEVLSLDQLSENEKNGS